MAKKKRKANSLWKKAALAVIGALVLMFGTAALVNKMLTDRKAPSNSVYLTSNPANSDTEKPKIEPDVTKNQNKETVPEQGKVDKKPETQPEQIEPSKPDTVEQPVKANDIYIDPFIENYLNIYVNLANDSELEFYYFDNVVMKDSNFYKALGDEILKLRQGKIKYVLEDFKVESITKGQSESELIVQVSQVINKISAKYSYTIYFDKNGVFIKDRKSLK